MAARLLALLVAAATVLFGAAQGRDNGLGFLPPMGWNARFPGGGGGGANCAGFYRAWRALITQTWCTWSSCGQAGNFTHEYHDVCSEDMVKSIAQVLVRLLQREEKVGGGPGPDGCPNSRLPVLQEMVSNGMQAAGYTQINLDE